MVYRNHGSAPHPQISLESRLTDDEYGHEVPSRHGDCCGQDQHPELCGDRRRDQRAEVIGNGAEVAEGGMGLKWKVPGENGARIGPEAPSGVTDNIKQALVKFPLCAWHMLSHSLSHP